MHLAMFSFLRKERHLAMQFALTNLIYLNKINPEYPIYTHPSQVRMQFIPTRSINLDKKA